MKKCILSLLSILLITGCSLSTDKNLEFSKYIKSTMMASLEGNIDNYITLTNSTKEEALNLYNNTIDNLLHYIINYYDINYDYLNEELKNKYKDISKQIISKVKYNIHNTIKKDNKYITKIELYPIDLFDITYTETNIYITNFNNKNINYNQLSETEKINLENEYANNILNIITNYINKINYKDVVIKEVEMIIDNNGNSGLSEEDWTFIDKTLIDMK